MDMAHSQCFPYVRLLKPYKCDPPKKPVVEEPLAFKDQEDILQPKSILRNEGKVLQSGKVIRCYLVKFKNYPFEDAICMQDIQLKDNLPLVDDYNRACQD